MSSRTGTEWRLRVALLSGLFAVVGVSVAALVPGGEHRPVWADSLREEKTPVLPAAPPPELEGLWPSSSVEGPFETTYYSINRPLVSLCTGAAAECKAGMREILRTERVGAYEVTVGIPPGGYAVGLGPELLEYWKSVALTTRRPQWLQDDTYNH